MKDSVKGFFNAFFTDIRRCHKFFEKIPKKASIFGSDQTPNFGVYGGHGKGCPRGDAPTRDRRLRRDTTRQPVDLLGMFLSKRQGSSPRNLLGGITVDAE